MWGKKWREGHFGGAVKWLLPVGFIIEFFYDGYTFK
jgi:hypothetical protein